MSWHDSAGLFGAAFLIIIGGLHVGWAFAPWPASSYQQLARYATGGPMPPPPACLAVGLGLLGGSYGILALVGALPEVGPHWIYQAGIWALTIVLFARGLTGPLWGMGACSEFKRWNLMMYSPLCVLLGLCGLVVVR